MGFIFAYRRIKMLKKYTCAICNKQFDKPKTKYVGSFIMEIIVFILGVICLGILPALALMIIISVLRLLTKRRVCPICNSQHFYKNNKE